MFKYFKDPDGNNSAFIALLKYKKDKTMGVSIYVTDPDVTEVKRHQKLIYKKEGK